MSDNEKFPCKAELLVDKNVNFLFGSGASAEYIPTLWIDEHNSYKTILTDKKLELFQKFIGIITNKSLAKLFVYFLLIVVSK